MLVNILKRSIIEEKRFKSTIRLTPSYIFKRNYPRFIRKKYETPRIDSYLQIIEMLVKLVFL